MQSIQRPTAAFVGASWGALLIGACAYQIGRASCRERV